MDNRQTATQLLDYVARSSGYQTNDPEYRKITQQKNVTKLLVALDNVHLTAYNNAIVENSHYTGNNAP